MAVLFIQKIAKTALGSACQLVDISRRVCCVIPEFGQKKWQSRKDSNLDKMNQNHLCYRYTTGLRSNRGQLSLTMLLI